MPCAHNALPPSSLIARAANMSVRVWVVIRLEPRNASACVQYVCSDNFTSLVADAEIASN